VAFRFCYAASAANFVFDERTDLSYCGKRVPQFEPASERLLYAIDLLE